MMALLGVTPLAAARWSESGPTAGAGVSVVDSELRLYGAIMSDVEAAFWGDDTGMVTNANVHEALDGMKGDIVVAINSPGGDVWSASGIYAALAAYDGKVNVRIDGVAASSAAFLAMAGDKITMGPMSQMMVHAARGVMYGVAAELRDYADLLDRTTGQLAGVLSQRLGMKPKKVMELLAEGDKWYTPEEAVAAGLADEVLKAKAPPKDDKKMAATAAVRATNLSMLLGTV